MFRKTSGRHAQYLVSSGFICAVSALCFLFNGYIGPEVVAFILLVALSINAMLFDMLPVLIAATVSALIWDYFFLVPRFNFRLGNTEEKNHAVYVFCNCAGQCGSYQ